MKVLERERESSLRKKMKKMGVKGALKALDHGHRAH